MLGPWTDAFDPACGADCGEVDEAESEPFGLCADTDCGPPTRLEMPRPTGPVCLEPGPDCGPADSTTAWLTIQMMAAPPTRVAADPPRRGTLPGAAPPQGETAAAWHEVVPDPPPPRVGA